jgi:glycosyltransferase involved in cell wall biosynthesis
MEFSIIIPAMNEEKLIENCLRSISDQTFPRDQYEIIVSDGCSKDGTIEISKKNLPTLLSCQIKKESGEGIAEPNSVRGNI